MRARAVLLSAAAALGVVFSCSSDEQPGAKDPPSDPPPGTIATSKTISADQGGSIDLPDGAVLEIPPGALAEDTTITVLIPEVQTGPASSMRYAFEPSGLTFAMPVTLTVPYIDQADGADPLIAAWQWSTLNAVEDHGSERSRWLGLLATGRDMTGNRVSYPLDHFSVLAMFIAVPEYGYLVKDIPGKFLQAGDILFTLTGLTGKTGPDFKPGHVSVFAGGRTLCSGHFSERIIESTPPVVTDTTTFAKLKAEHVYLGARRVEGGLGLQERAALVSWAGDRIGTAYSEIGYGNLNERGFSCIGFAEAALDSIDRGVINAYYESFVPVPLDLYVSTVPVDRIQVEVGEELHIPIRAVLVHPSTPYWGGTLTGHYCRREDNCCHEGICNEARIEATMSRDVATFGREADGVHHFRWTPTSADANSVLHVEFEMTYAPRLRNGDDFETVYGLVERETLIIEVLPCPDDGSVSASTSSGTTSATSSGGGAGGDEGQGGTGEGGGGEAGGGGGGEGGAGGSTPDFDGIWWMISAPDDCGDDTAQTVYAFWPDGAVTRQPYDPQCHDAEGTAYVAPVGHWSYDAATELLTLDLCNDGVERTVTFAYDEVGLRWTGDDATCCDSPHQACLISKVPDWPFAGMCVAGPTCVPTPDRTCDGQPISVPYLDCECFVCEECSPGPPPWQAGVTPTCH